MTLLLWTILSCERRITFETHIRWIPIINSKLTAHILRFQSYHVFRYDEDRFEYS